MLNFLEIYKKNHAAGMNEFNMFVWLQCLVDDIHVVCGCLKDFLRSLKEPLITYQLWNTFVKAAGELAVPWLVGKI